MKRAGLPFPEEVPGDGVIVLASINNASINEEITNSAAF
ncbi:hypothetical protein SD78_3021 [Bacillus badius]|nr:hypothetical protein SD78_3021 [Bacillus badius]